METNQEKRIALLKEYRQLLSDMNSLHIKAVQSLVRTCSEIVESLFPGSIQRNPDTMADDLEKLLSRIEEMIPEANDQLSPAANEDNYSAWVVIDTLKWRLRQISALSVSVTENGVNLENIQTALYLQKLTLLTVYKHVIPRNCELDESSEFRLFLEDADPRIRVMAVEVASKIEETTAEMLQHPEYAASRVGADDIERVRNNLRAMLEYRLTTGGGKSSDVPINERPEEELFVINETLTRLRVPIEAAA